MRKSSPIKPRRTAGADAVSAMRRRMVSTGLVLVLVLAVVDGMFGERGLLANRDMEQRNALAQTIIDEMRDRNDGLTDEIRRLREDPAAVEELAREELGLMMDGELLVILRDTPSVPRPPADARASASRSR